MTELQTLIPDRIPDLLGNLGWGLLASVEQKQIQIRTWGQVSSPVTSDRHQSQSRWVSAAGGGFELGREPVVDLRSPSLGEPSTPQGLVIEETVTDGGEAHGPIPFSGTGA
jgi:hypothetical protein